MSKVKISLNSSGVRELLKSSEVMSALNQEADKIIGKCSGNYYKSEYVGTNRANVSINCADWETYHHNLKTNEIIKAVGS